MVGDIKRLAAGFSSCSFKHVNRVCNGAAHNLARSLKPSLCKLFVRVIPVCMRDELYNDIIKSMKGHVSKKIGIKHAAWSEAQQQVRCWPIGQLQQVRCWPIVQPNRRFIDWTVRLRCHWWLC
jgi:hypothetical protein